MLTSPSIRTQIDALTSIGNQSLSQAVNTGNYSDFAKAIQVYILKCSWLKTFTVMDVYFRNIAQYPLTKTITFCYS